MPRRETDDHIRWINHTIRQHGWCIQSVFPTDPGHAPWSYTIGNHGCGLPELVLAGFDVADAEAILNELCTAARAGDIELRPGTLLVAPEAAPGRNVGREHLPLMTLAPVGARWARRWAPQVFTHDVPADPETLLRVVVPAAARSIPETEPRDPTPARARPEFTVRA